MSITICFEDSRTKIENYLEEEKVDKPIFSYPNKNKNLANQEDDYPYLNTTQHAILTEMQARFLEMTSKYQEEEERRQRRGYVEEDPADSGNYHQHQHHISSI